MRAIVEHTTESYAATAAGWSALKKKVRGTSARDWFDEYSKVSGYAHYTFSGVITDKLVELLGHTPSSDEIIMLVDDGFSHFGATCTINGRRFTGRVNTD